MIVKVCGIGDIENAKQIAALDIDMIGLNFYKPSSRYVTVEQAKKLASNMSVDVYKVGVFVNEEIEVVRLIYDQVGLDYIQLHGDESLSYCQELSKTCKVIKVFRVDDDFDMSVVYSFEACSAYFLFDTKTKSFGGSGKEFNWKILNAYTGATPFFLSGGIGPESAQAVNEWTHDAYIGIDINSKFERKPAVKNIEEVKQFVGTIKESFKQKNL